MSWAEKISKGVVYALLTGTTFYLLGGITSAYLTNVNSTIIASIGALGAFAIATFPSET